MAAVVVATMVVGPLVKIVMQKASNSLLGQYKVMKGMEEQHEILKRRLLAILDIITDAEQAAADSGQAAARREGVIAWLEAIKKVAYQGNEVFDELKYEALRRKAKKEGQYKDLGFHVVKLFPTHNRFIFCQRMGKKLRKVLRAIEDLVKEMNDFGFHNQQQPPLSYQWRHTDHDLFDPKKIINRSRAKDNKNIIDILVSQGNNADLTVVPIVGIGGLGKTTLAQLVYNDPEIQKHFDMLLWVCVSDSFDVNSLAKSIVEAAPKNNCIETAASKTKKTPLGILQNVLSGQRYLLVLDDVWTREDHKWKKLKASLEHGGMGSVILTTTRDKLVAKIMGTVESYNLGALGEQYIKEIIETMAFSRLKKEEERPTMLLNMVGEIVERCAGCPLAAMALGSMLRNKTSEEEWKAVSSRSNCTVEYGILPILKLSYNDLPPHIKQCFAFCAIFPKDYEIDVDKLIQLWIAHGFIIEEEQVRPETTGKQIFDELASRFFFQDVKQVRATVSEIEGNGVCYSRTTCKIHDLMHDVALSIMEKECFIASEEPSQSVLTLNTARHIFLPSNKLPIFYNYQVSSSASIQTLLCDRFMSSSFKLLSKYSSLQALQLSGISSFPLKPKHLHHLKYLDLSGNCIGALPEDMSILYNLQTLNLSGCRYLAALPRQMKYMTALRHLYTHGCPKLKSMPRDLRKLISLQTLTCFVAGSGSNCSNVGELANLSLGGELELRHLENVTEEDAKAANLVKKKLRELTLKWTTGSDKVVDETSCPDEERVLKELKPHDRLHAIRIHSYGATTFPTWMGMLQNIIAIHLYHCNKLQWLFNHSSNTSFTFPNLKELTLQELVCLERLWEIDNGTQGEEIMFPRLEKLCISHCEKLTTLPGQPNFPNLQNACIERCPELTTTLKSPKLNALNLEGREVHLFQCVARHMTSLTSLVLSILVDSTETTSAEAEHGLRELLDGKERWKDHDFPLAVLRLRKLNFGVVEICACFLHLQDLSIDSCHALVHWPEKLFVGLESLKSLRIDSCSNLTGYAQASAEPSTSSEASQLLPRLEYLIISNCESLVEIFNVPSSLRDLRIVDCSKLEFIYGRRPQKGQSASSDHQGSDSILEVLASSLPGAGIENLKYLLLSGCDGLAQVLHVPKSLKLLEIFDCAGLTSLEFHLVEHPLLERLTIGRCSTLSSLPDAPQAYSSLQQLYIRACHCLRMLPASLQQHLGSIQIKQVDDHYYGDTRRHIPTLLKPKTWKYVVIRRD